jgi:dienelactone hydrolase
MRLAGIVGLVLVATQNLPSGTVIQDVRCQADPSQGYALYLPAAYTPTRPWPVILAFDPGARGRTPVERYQAAAELYGFIVAGSNNSRNGPMDASARAVAAMAADVGQRFAVDAKRVYAAGMSGGARVAFATAISSRGIAGVIASSAGYHDGKMRRSLPFPVFATAGTEDFNHLEMRLLDRELTTPHRLAIFDGGHTWLSSELATQAVEFMVVQAIKTKIAARDEAVLDRIFAKWLAAAEAMRDRPAQFLALQGIARDFEGVRDVAAIAKRVDALGREREVRDALKRDRDEDVREEQLLTDVRTAETQLASDETRPRALMELRRQWKAIADAARRPDESPERRMMRRVLAALGAGVTTTDPEYLKIIAEYRPARGR